MARRQNRIRCNPNSRVCKSLVSKGQYSHKADRNRHGSSGYVPAGVRRVQEFFCDLKAMGFASYEAYLTSPLWAHVRGEAFKRWGTQCKACGFAAQQIHHANYAMETLKGETTDGLWPICRNCHQRAHGEPGSIDSANAWIKAMWRKRKDRV